MSIHVGQPVPSLSASAYVRDADGPVPVALPGASDEWTVLFFYPADFTFVCPTELRALAMLEPELRAASATIVAASTDGYWTHRAWYAQEPGLDAVGFPVIADTSHEVSRAYGVLAEDGTALRGTFIVDPEGVLRHASVTDRNVGRRAPEVLRILQALQTGELCPVDWEPGASTLGLAA